MPFLQALNPRQSSGLPLGTARGRSTFPRGCDPSPRTAKIYCSEHLPLSCRRSPDAWVLGGEVDLSLNDDPWAQSQSMSQWTSQHSAVPEAEAAQIQPFFSSPFPPARSPQPPAQEQRLRWQRPSTSWGHFAYPALTSLFLSHNYVVDSLDRQAEVRLTFQGQSGVAVSSAFVYSSSLLAGGWGC